MVIAMKTKNKLGFWVTVLAVSILLTLTGCMGDYGRLKEDPALTDAFKNGRALPDYNYFYCGRENLPYAVVGIDPAYQFEDRVWFKIETKEEVYKKAASVVAWNHIWSKGAEILDPSGNRIGIWFSYYQHTTVKVGPENKVAVYNPYSPNKKSSDRDYGPP
jgi:hypothetical protein